ASALLLVLAGAVDFRLFYIGFALFTILIAFRKFMGSDIPYKLIAIGGILLGLMQLYWLIPFITSGSNGGSVLNRSLFGSQFWDLQSAITLHHPFWNGATTTWFVVQDIPMYFWIIPALVITSF